jgi:methionine-rich copper-binding protein CopC
MISMTIRTRTFVATLVLAIAAAVTISAHMAYSKSMPEEDATVTESPDHLQVWFTQAPEPAVSRLSLEGPGGEVELSETTVGDEKSIVAAVPSTLGPGSYTVNWRSAGDDGHVMRGDFSFTIRAAND